MLDSSLVTGTIEIGSCTVSETERKEMWARKPLYSGDSDMPALSPHHSQARELCPVCSGSAVTVSKLNLWNMMLLLWDWSIPGQRDRRSGEITHKIRLDCSLRILFIVRFDKGWLEIWQQIEAEVLFHIIIFFFISVGASVQQPKEVLEG